MPPARDAQIAEQRKWANAQPWHSLDWRQVAQFTGTDAARGLPDAEVASRVARFGPNELFGDTGPSWWKVLLGNIFNAMNAVLTIAMVMSFVVKDYPVAASLIIVMILNTVISYIQEYRGEKTMEALKSMSSPTARAIRNREEVQLPTRDLVPGDLVHLQEGDVVPADLRLVECVNLEIDEALLTGESLPVAKNLAPVPAETGIADRLCLAYMNTIVTKGRAKGIVISTSLCTEIGGIASSLSAPKQKPRPPGVSPFAWQIRGIMGWRDKTELQIAMDQLMYFLLLCALVLGIIVFAVDGMKFSPALLLYAVSVGVAIIPEGLPAVVTVTMSLGVARMAKQKAIVRKLSALEALGQVTDICSDKTGTLTEGKMTSTRYFIAASSKEYRVSGRGLNPTGKIRELELDELISHEQITAEKPHYLLALNCALNVTCDLFVDDASGAWKSTGDPTEVALLVLSRKMLEAPPEDYEFAAEHPFDPSIKRMSVVFLHRKSRTFHVFAKGALERVLQVCGSVCGSEVELSVKADEAEDVMEEMASDAMRVLAFGWKQVAISGDGELDGAADEVLSRFAPELKNREVAESGMEFLGVVGMYDPPRPETKPSVGICHEAGINVRMATGDHVSTAAAVAREVDIILPYRKQIVMAASEFDELEPEQVDGLKELPSVLARCAPKTKVKLVEGIHRRGGFVAMTGDGSNDAPAIRMADVGIAMGLGGSEVTKQVASIVLTDDNFSTIVNAIAEGRRIFANITKFVVHLLASNVAEVLALVAGLAFRDSLGHSIFPMSPIQVLWLNLFTSSPIALALGQEKADPSIMRLPPRPLDQGILTNKEVLFDTFFYGLFMGAMSLGTFVGVLYKEGGPLSVGDCNHGFTDDSCIAAFKARGAAFALLTFNLLVLGMECRDPRRSIFKMRLRGNRGLVLITVAALIGTVLTIYIPFINTSVFMHYPLTWEWAIVAPAQLVLLGAIELYKLWKRRAVWWNPEDSAKGYQFADADEAISRYSREGFVSFEIRRGGVAGPLGREDTISLATSNVQVGNEAIGARRGSEKPPAGAVPEMTSVGLPFERERTITFGPVNRPEDRV